MNIQEPSVSMSDEEDLTRVNFFEPSVWDFYIDHGNEIPIQEYEDILEKELQRVNEIQEGDENE